MKGILKNDFYSVMEYGRMIFAVILLFIIIGVAKHNVLFMTLYPLLMLSIIPVSILSVDERFGWDKYMLTFPINKKDYVTSKYLLNVILTGLGSVVIFALSVLMKFDLKSTLVSSMILIAFSLVYNGILLPFMFRFGVVKGKIIYMVSFFIWGALFGGMSGLFYSENVNTSGLYGNFSAGVVGLILVFAVAIYTLSWFISAKVYNKRNV